MAGTVQRQKVVPIALKKGEPVPPKHVGFIVFFFFDSFFSLEEGLLSCEEGVMEISSS